MAQQIICSFRCLTYFLMNRSVMMQFQIALGWFLKLKQVTQVNHNKNLMIQACNFIKKRLHHRWFPVINAKFWRTPVSKSICNQLFLKIYPLLLFWFLEEISEVAFCQCSMLVSYSYPLTKKDAGSFSPLLCHLRPKLSPCVLHHAHTFCDESFYRFLWPVPQSIDKQYVEGLGSHISSHFWL